MKPAHDARRGAMLRVPGAMAPATLSCPVLRLDTDLAAPAGLEGLHGFRLGALGLATLALVGCAGVPGRPAPTDLALPPAATAPVQAGHIDADAAYAAGQQMLERARPGQALALFEQAAAARPGWSDAQIGRAMALVRMGLVNEAIAVTAHALQGDPYNADLSGHLGLLQLRYGRFDEARAHLLRAAELDPANTTWSTWLATPAFAPFAPATVSTALVQANLRRPLQASVAPAIATAPVLEAPVVVAARDESAQRNDVRPGPQAAPKTARRIEVSNGAGRLALARHTAHALRAAGLPAQRISNHANFAVRKTEVHYRDAADFDAALAVARSLALPVRMVADAALAPQVDVKVVLGHDAAQRDAALAMRDDRQVARDALAAGKRPLTAGKTQQATAKAQKAAAKAQQAAIKASKLAAAPHRRAEMPAPAKAGPARPAPQAAARAPALPLPVRAAPPALVAPRAEARPTPVDIVLDDAPALDFAAALGAARRLAAADARGATAPQLGRSAGTLQDWAAPLAGPDDNPLAGVW